MYRPWRKVHPTCPLNHFPKHGFNSHKSKDTILRAKFSRCFLFLWKSKSNPHLPWPFGFCRDIWAQLLTGLFRKTCKIFPFQQLIATLLFYFSRWRGRFYTNTETCLFKWCLPGITRGNLKVFQSKSGFQQVSLHEKSYYTLLQYHKRRVKAVDFFSKSSLN